MSIGKRGMDRIVIYLCTRHQYAEDEFCLLIAEVVSLFIRSQVWGHSVSDQHDQRHSQLTIALATDPRFIVWMRYVHLLESELVLPINLQEAKHMSLGSIL